MRATEVVRESVLNVVFMGWLSALIIALGGVLSLAAILTEGSEVGGILDRERARIQQGANALQITPATDESLLSAKRCEELNRVVGVRSAGGIVSTSTVEGLTSDSSGILLQATQGAVPVLFPNIRTVPPGHLLATPALADANGWIDGGPATAIAHDNRLVFDVSVLTAPRAESYGSALIDVVVPAGDVPLCLVESDNGALQGVTDVVTDWFGSTAVALAPMALQDSTYTPQQQLQSRMTVWLPAFSGLGLALFVVFFWKFRERDFALYALHGVRRPRLLLMLVTEWTIMTALPASMGALGGLLLLRQHLEASVVLEALGYAYASVLIGASVALPAGVWLLSGARAHDRIRGG